MRKTVLSKGKALADSRQIHPAFDRREAFSRNVGWVTQEEQDSLRAKRVAIAGMGGVGGIYLLNLARLGVGSFRIADFDRFELANMNRQAGATMSNLGREKVEVMREMALDINPELDIRVFDGGVTPDNVEMFLGDSDVFLDGIDFFALDARRLLFESCAREGIPAVTAAPLGMGASLLNFMPGEMTFEEYFQLEGHPRLEQLLRFVVGLAPTRLHAGYLVEPSAVDFENDKGPSMPMGVLLCAGLAVTEILKILLGRGPVRAAPRGLHFDAYRNRLVRTWRPGGNRNPLHRLMLFVARRQLRGIMDGRERQSSALGSVATPAMQRTLASTGDESPGGLAQEPSGVGAGTLESTKR